MTSPGAHATQRPPRLFFADELLSGRVGLAGYPFRYVCIAPSRTTALVGGLGRGGANNLVDQLLSAVELVESWGWELVNVDNGATLAFLRRVR